MCIYIYILAYTCMLEFRAIRTDGFIFAVIDSVIAVVHSYDKWLF